MDTTKACASDMFSICPRCPQKFTCIIAGQHNDELVSINIEGAGRVRVDGKEDINFRDVFDFFDTGYGTLKISTSNDLDTTLQDDDFENRYNDVRDLRHYITGKMESKDDFLCVLCVTKQLTINPASIKFKHIPKIIIEITVRMLNFMKIPYSDDDINQLKPRRENKNKWRMIEHG